MGRESECTVRLRQRSESKPQNPPDFVRRARLRQADLASHMHAKPKDRPIETKNQAKARTAFVLVEVTSGRKAFDSHEKEPGQKQANWSRKNLRNGSKGSQNESKPMLILWEASKYVTRRHPASFLRNSQNQPTILVSILGDSSTHVGNRASTCSHAYFRSKSVGCKRWLKALPSQVQYVGQKGCFSASDRSSPVVSRHAGRSAAVLPPGSPLSYPDGQR